MKTRTVAALFCIISFMLSTPASAQVVLRGGIIHTMTDAAPIEGGVVVLAADGTIAAVGGADTPIPSGVAVVELAADKHVTPGLIDAYTGLGAVEVDAVSATSDRDANLGLVRAAFMIADAFNPRSAVIPVQRMGGVTDALVVPTGGLISGQAAWIELAGADQTTFGRLVAERVALVMTMGERGASLMGGSRGALVMGLRLLFDDVAFYLKNKKLFDEGRTRPLAASRLDLEALGQVQAAQTPVLIRADSASDIEAALAFGAQQRLRVVIVGGAQAWMIAPALAKAKVPVILDAMDNLPNTFASLGARLDNAALLHAAGVPVVLSTFETHRVHLLRQYAGNAVRAGLPHEAALAAITRAPAEALGMDKTRGQLVAGKVANLVIWSGDPLEFSTRVDAMYIRSEPVSLESRQRALFERYKALPRRGEAKPSEAKP
jgi:imidazolonepropionase-like amidohydrolase